MQLVGGRCIIAGFNHRQKRAQVERVEHLSPHKKEPQCRDKIDREQLHTFHPVALAILRDNCGDKDRHRQHRHLENAAISLRWFSPFMFFPYVSE
jgi:hypothetical protein